MLSLGGNLSHYIREEMISLVDNTLNKAFNGYNTPLIYCFQNTVSSPLSRRKGIGQFTISIYKRNSPRL